MIFFKQSLPLYLKKSMRAIDEGLEWLNEVKYIKTQDKDGGNPIKHEIKKSQMDKGGT